MLMKLTPGLLRNNTTENKKPQLRLSKQNVVSDLDNFSAKVKKNLQAFLVIRRGYVPDKVQPWNTKTVNFMLKTLNNKGRNRKIPALKKHEYQDCK